MKLNTTKNKAILLACSVVVVLLSYLLLLKPFDTSESVKNPTPVAESQIPDAATDIQRLTQRSGAQPPQVISRKEIHSIPAELLIYNHPETDSLIIESLGLKNGLQGYSMEFKLGYSLLSSVNYYIKIFKDNSITNLYAGFGDNGGVLYGNEETNYILITFVKINDNDTKINITKYAH